MPLLIALSMTDDCLEATDCIMIVMKELLYE